MLHEGTALAQLQEKGELNMTYTPDPELYPITVEKEFTFKSHKQLDELAYKLLHQCQYPGFEEGYPYDYALLKAYGTISFPLICNFNSFIFPSSRNLRQIEHSG